SLVHALWRSMVLPGLGRQDLRGATGYPLVRVLSPALRYGVAAELDPWRSTLRHASPSARFRTRVGCPRAGGRIREPGGLADSLWTDAWDRFAVHVERD